VGTPLGDAIERDRPDCAVALLEAGAKPVGANDQPLLPLAVHKRMAGVVHAMLAAGAAVGTLAAASTLAVFTAGSGLWRMASTDRSRRGNMVSVRGILMAVGRVIRTIGITGITVHLLTGSIPM